jgi:hypothetical protein
MFSMNRLPSQTRVQILNTLVVYRAARVISPERALQASVSASDAIRRSIDDPDIGQVSTSYAAQLIAFGKTLSFRLA